MGRLRGVLWPLDLVRGRHSGVGLPPHFRWFHDEIPGLDDSFKRAHNVRLEHSLLGQSLQLTRRSLLQHFSKTNNGNSLTRRICSKSCPSSWGQHYHIFIDSTYEHWIRSSKFSPLWVFELKSHLFLTSIQSYVDWLFLIGFGECPRPYIQALIPRRSINGARQVSSPISRSGTESDPSWPAVQGCYRSFVI